MEELRRPCPKCGEMIMAQAVVCRFCKTDFRAPRTPLPPPPPPKPSKLPILIILLAVAGAAVPVVAIVAAIAIPAFLSTRQTINEFNAAASLRAICTAETDFRANDRDRNGVRDFWTGDVAGLYALRPGDSQRSIRLIDPSIAAADGAPLSEDIPENRWAPLPGPAQPKGGYYFLAMTHDGSKGDASYQQDTNGTSLEGPYYNPAPFAFCAYPADHPSLGRFTFIVSEAGHVWKKDTGGEPVTRWPANPRAEGWQLHQQTSGG